MAPRPSTPRLSGLKAEEVGRQIRADLRPLLEEIMRLLGLDNTDSLEALTKVKHDPINRFLTWIFQGDEREWAGWPWRQTIETLATFYGPVSRDLSHPVGVVLLAARCRVQLEANEPVRIDELAACGSASVRRIRQLVEDGTLGGKRRSRRSKHDTIPAKAARAWLLTRGLGEGKSP